MFKNALVYRIEEWALPTLTEFETRLATSRFIECGATQPESSGWVAPRGDEHGALAESVGGQIILKLRTETKAVPGSVVKTQVQAQLDRIEKESGRRPRGKLVKELKQEVIHTLLPRAFPKRAETLVWVDAKARLVLVGAASAKKADALVTRLLELLGGGARLALLQTALAPATAMAAWLAEKQAPRGFAIDRDCELKQPDSEKATVRYARHTLDIAEVGAHIQQGKLPTQLALTWQGRVSFVLTETMALKRIKLLDVALEGTGAAAGREDDGFDADVALTTGELRMLIPELVEALGGVHEREKPPAAKAAAASTGAPWDPVPA
ncbi:MAG: recombination-associated protein RdgC [Rubrivivax sp.]|nr:recombination-associated protein RdgC [Rubrivivax sp.]